MVVVALVVMVVVLKAVVDVEGASKLQLDKGKLSSMLRTHTLHDWGQGLFAGCGQA